MTSNQEIITPQISEKLVSVWNGRITMRVKVAGSGKPLVYLHPSAGLNWDPFLSWLSKHFTVYAPEFPGTSAGDPYAIHTIHSLSDMALMYEEMIRELGIESPVMVGQSFGGMLTAEIVAAFPSLASRVVLLDPIGLWNEKFPVADWISISPEELPQLLFHEPGCPAAQAMLKLPEDLNQMAAAIAAMTWAIGCTGKFVWPIPDRGLAGRLHRISASVLLVWGRQDKLASVEYVDEWRALVRDCRAAVIDNCGHIPQVEKCAETIAEVSNFLQLA